MDTTHEQMSQQEPSTGKRLVRPNEGRVLAGVAAGMGEYLGIDPILVRLGFVALTVFGGAGVLVYLFAALMIPAEDGSRRDVSWLIKGIIIVIGFALVAQLVLGVIGSFMGFYAVERLLWMGSYGLGFFELLVGAVLIWAGFYLLRGDRSARAEPPAGDAPAATGAAITSPSGKAVPGSAGVPASASRPDAPSRTFPARRVSPLPALTLAAVFVVVGMLTGLTNAGLVDLDIGQLVAAGMFVIGAGLLAGAWIGRSRLLIIPALLLVPLLIVASFIDLPPRGSFGSRYLMVDSVEQIEPAYELLLGDLTLDLSEIPAGEFGDRTLDLDVAAGRAIVYLPQGLEVDIVGNIGLGVANVGPGRLEGSNLALDVHHDGVANAGSILINVEGGVASLTVDRIERTDTFIFEDDEPVIDLDPPAKKKRKGNK